jgi:hypothetical protein
MDETPGYRRRDEVVSGRRTDSSDMPGDKRGAPVEDVSPQAPFTTRTLLDSYRAKFDVPAALLRYLSRLLAAERHRRGTPARSRKLSRRDQALLALRWFRDRTRIEQLGHDHGVSRATAYRYVAEAFTSCPPWPRPC